MRIKANFCVCDEILYSLQFEHEVKHVWQAIQYDWADAEFVNDFLTQFENDVKKSPWGSMKWSDLLANTVRNVRDMQKNVFLAAKAQANGADFLDRYFQPLYDLERPLLDFQQVKYKRQKPPKWFRMYGIRVDAELFFLTGATIKLAHRMEEHKETEIELRKLNVAKEFLKAHLDNDNLLEEGYL